MNTEQIIYGDILFIINFSMDFLSMFISSKIMRYKAKTITLFISAVIGSLYSVASLLYTGNNILSIIIHISVSIFMCFIVFGKDNKLFFLRASILFWVISFVLGGTMTAVYNIINKNKYIYINGGITTIYNEASPVTILIIAAVSAVISIIAGRIINRKRIEKVLKVKIINDNLETTFTCLYDSGNLLREPISGIPVIITNYKTIENILPAEIKHIIKHNDTEKISTIGYKYIKKIRLIPVTTVGYSGIVIGFIPDQVVVNDICREACIAVYNDHKNFGGYEAIAPAEII